MHLNAKVSKVDYSSKAGISNVRGVGTFFGTYSNLGHLAPYKFKDLYSHFVFSFKPLFYCMVLFEASFGISVKLLSQ